MTRFSVLSSTCESECSLPQALAYLDLEIFFVPIPSSLAILSFPPKPQVGKNRKKDSDERTGPLLFCTQLPEFSCRGPERKRERERRNIDSGRSTFPSSSPFHMRRGRARRKTTWKIKSQTPPEAPKGSGLLVREIQYTHTQCPRRKGEKVSLLFFFSGSHGKCSFHFLLSARGGLPSSSSSSFSLPSFFTGHLGKRKEWGRENACTESKLLWPAIREREIRDLSFDHLCLTNTS